MSELLINLQKLNTKFVEEQLGPFKCRSAMGWGEGSISYEVCGIKGVSQGDCSPQEAIKDLFDKLIIAHSCFDVNRCDWI